MQKKIEDIINKFVAGNSSEEEKRVLSDWTNEAKENLDALNDAIELESTIINQNSLKEVDIDAAYQKVMDKVSNKKKKDNRSLIWLVIIALILSIGYFVKVKMIDKQLKEPLIFAAVDNILSEKLEDGTLFSLGRNAIIVENAKRKISLKGLAEFQVTKDPINTFEIKLENGKITVIGTEFTVFSRGNEEEIYVNEGRVKYQYNTVSVVLEAGDYAKLIEGDIVVLNNPPDNIKSWKAINLKFNDTNLYQVISDLERHFSVDIHIAKVEQKLKMVTITSNFEGESLNQILNQLKTLFGISYEMSDGQITLLDIKNN